MFFLQQVDAADPPFPRPSAHWWFGCKNSPSTFTNNTPLGNVMLEEQDASHRTTSSDVIDDFALFDAGEWNRPQIFNSVHNP